MHQLIGEGFMLSTKRIRVLALMTIAVVAIQAEDARALGGGDDKCDEKFCRRESCEDLGYCGEKNTCHVQGPDCDKCVFTAQCDSGGCWSFPNPPDSVQGDELRCCGSLPTSFGGSECSENLSGGRE
jgi:hypothetical protein